MDLGLGGKACAVTGASRGIGRHTARLLAEEGASVLLVARGAEVLAEAADECRAAGGDAHALALDVTDADAGERIVAAGEERFGRLDVLVNNAGTARWRDLDEVPEADWYAAWELNVMAPLRAMRAAIPGMVERGWGRVVNVSSTAGKRPSAQMPEYSVAKAAELSLSRLFADRHAARGARERGLPGADQVGDVDGRGRPARPVAGDGRDRVARGGVAGGGREATDRPPRRGRRDRRGDRLPVLGARLLRRRGRLVGRRRNRAGDHLMARLDAAAFDLPVEPLRDGWYTDAYFNHARATLEGEGLHPPVLMQVFQRHDAVLGGIDEALAVLRLCAGSRRADGSWEPGWERLEVKALEEGDRIEPQETVLTIEGDYGLFAHLETAYLGALARRTLVMRNTAEVVAPRPASRCSTSPPATTTGCCSPGTAMRPTSPGRPG